MEWEIHEHLYFEKSNDWYASVIIIAAALLALAFMFGSYLLVVLIIVGTAATLLVVSRQPDLMHVSLGSTGVHAGNTYYPYASLDAFAIAHHPLENKIILESARHIMPLIYIPVHPDFDLGDIRKELLQHLPEKDLRESQFHLWLERWGF